MKNDILETDGHYNFYFLEDGEGTESMHVEVYKSNLERFIFSFPRESFAFYLKKEDVKKLINNLSELLDIIK